MRRSSELAGVFLSLLISGCSAARTIQTAPAVGAQHDPSMAIVELTRAAGGRFAFDLAIPVAVTDREAWDRELNSADAFDDPVAELVRHPHVNEDGTVSTYERINKTAGEILTGNEISFAHWAQRMPRNRIGKIGPSGRLTWEQKPGRFVVWLEIGSDWRIQTKQEYIKDPRSPNSSFLALDVRPGETYRIALDRSPWDSSVHVWTLELDSSRP